MNVFLHAFFTRSDSHAPAANWLNRSRKGAELVGVPDLVLSGFLRIATNRQLFPEDVPVEQARGFCDLVRGSSAVIRLVEGPRHWETFRQLIIETGTTGPHVSDAYLAAFAFENNATFVTFDRGFLRFPGLRVAELA